MGNNKAKKRRLQRSSTAKTKMAKKEPETEENQSEPNTAVGSTRQSIIVDVAPEDDDEFVKTLVHVQKTQLSINSRNSSRTTRNGTTAAVIASSEKGGIISLQTQENIAKLVPLTVQVPSMQYIFETYGRYLIVKEQSAVAEYSPVPEIKSEIKPESEDLGYAVGTKNTLYDISRDFSIVRGGDSEKNTQERVINKVPKVPQEHSLATGIDLSLGDTSVGEKDSKNSMTKSNRTTRLRGRKSEEHSIATTTQNTLEKMSNLGENTDVGIFQKAMPEKESVPTLPKRVTLKKDLISQMMDRLQKSKGSCNKMKNYDKNEMKTKSDVGETQSANSSVPIITIDSDDKVEHSLPRDDSSNNGETNRALILKQEIDLEDDLIVPRIETISGATTLQNRTSDSDHDIAMSSDEDDFDADPDFDPDVEESVDIRRSIHLSKKRQSDSTQTAVCRTSTNKQDNTTCETCRLRFMSIQSYKVHMKEYHNEYTSTDEDLSSQQNEHYICKECELPFGSQVGLKIHMRAKHHRTSTQIIQGVTLDVELKESKSSNDTALPSAQQTPIIQRVLYVCSFPDCDRQFGSIQNMKIHKCLQHGFKPQLSISCILCKAVGMLPGAFFHHLKSAHSDQVDDEGFGEFVRLGHSEEKEIKTNAVPSPIIEKVSEKQKSYKCLQCNISFQWEATLEAHTTALHTVRSAGGNRRSVSQFNVVNDSPVLAAHLARTSADHDPKEGIPDPEIINLSDSVDNDNAARIQATNVFSSGSKNNQFTKISIETSSKSPEVITVCPFCFKSVLFKDFPTHVEVHANDNNSKKFSCPYSGCKDAQNTLKELIAHHRSAHQEKHYTRGSSDSQKLQSESLESVPINKTFDTASSVSSKSETLDATVSAASKTKSLDATSSVSSKIKSLGTASSVESNSKSLDATAPVPSSSLGIIGFMCSVCDNAKFPDMASLLMHCQMLHSKQAPTVEPIRTEDIRGVRKGIQHKSVNIIRPSEISIPPPPPVTVMPIATIGSEDTTYALIPMERDPLEIESTIESSSSSDIKVMPLAIIDQEPTPNIGSTSAMAANINTITLNYGIQKMDTTSGIQVLPLVVPPRLKCPVCHTENFVDEGELEMHILSHTTHQEVVNNPLSSLICELCQAPFVTYEELNQHCVVYHKMSTYNLPASCPICKASIKHARNMSRHVTHKHHMHMCGLCSQLFKQEDQYLRHITLHSAVGLGPKGKQRYQCLECLQTFESTNGIFHHYNAVHNEGDKCTCVTCNIQLQRKNLQTHLQLHQRGVPSTAGSKAKQLASRANTYAGGNSSLERNVYLETGGLSSNLLLQTTVHQRDDIADEILSDPLADPGEESVPVTVFHQSFGETQFEFEDVTIGEEAEGTYEGHEFGEMTY